MNWIIQEITDHLASFDSLVAKHSFPSGGLTYPFYCSAGSCFSSIFWLCLGTRLCHIPTLHPGLPACPPRSTWHPGSTMCNSTLSLRCVFIPGLPPSPSFPTRLHDFCMFQLSESLNKPVSRFPFLFTGSGKQAVWRERFL